LELNLQQFKQTSARPPIIVAAALGDARADALVPMLARYARELYFVAPQQERALSPEALKQRIPESANVPGYCTRLAEIFPQANRCTLGERGDTIIVSGSLYLIGEILEYIQSDRSGESFSLQDKP